MSDFTVVELGGVKVGPDEWLVLTCHDGVPVERLVKIREQIPQPLRNRVLIVSGVEDVRVVAKS